MRPENKSFAKFIGIPVFALIGLGAIMGGGGSSGSTTETAATAADAAQVGDVVTIRYPSSTVMCANREDASKVYIVGETMLRQTWRIENSVSKAVNAEREGQKHAMATAYSCEWAPKGNFVVKKKEIVGDKNSLYHVAEYCLKPYNRDDCWWIGATATMGAQIDRVKPKAGASK